MDPRSKIAFARFYQLNVQDYADISVAEYPLSNRTANCLWVIGVRTVADLLSKSPAELMGISGFGITCLREIEQTIESLSSDRVRFMGAQMYKKPESKINEAMHGEITLAEQYKLDLKEFEEIAIQSLGFSVRAYNVFMRSGILTLSDLLKMTERQLCSLRNFGKTCMNEIDAVLAKIAKNGLTWAEERTLFIEEHSEKSELNPDDSVESLPLSVRTLNCLKREKISTLSQFMELSQEGLQQIRNMGSKSIREVLTWQNMLVTVNGQYYRTELVAADEEQWQPNDEEVAIINDLVEWLGIEKESATLILRILVRDELVSGERLIYKLYENQKVNLALRKSVLRMLDCVEGISLEGIQEKLPRHLENTAVLEDLLLLLEKEEKIVEEEGLYRCKHQDLLTFIKTLPEREQQVLQARVSGRTLAEVGDTRNITRERVRQIENKALRKRPRLEEDRYIYIFENYYFSLEDFRIAFAEPDATYHYLEIVTYNKTEKKRSLEELLEDDHVSLDVKKKVRRAAYKDYFQLDGQLIPKQRVALVRYAVQRFAKEKIDYDSFVKNYQALLEELDAAENERLSLNGRTYSNHLASCNFALWNYNNAFRYYNIDGTDFSELLDAIDLKQYENVELSTYKLFREHSELMKRYDIRDEYELHNLLKKIVLDENVHFLRMPNVSIGVAERDEQALELLIRYAPISAYDLADKYEEEYGVRATTVLANYFKCLDMYYHDGTYSIDLPALLTEEKARMREILTEDYYTISHIVRLYQREFPNMATERINSYSLKSLGFSVYSNYVIRSTHKSAKEYFKKLLTENDILDLRIHPQQLLYNGSFTTMLSNLRAEREIVEFSPKQYVNIRKLQEVGCGKEILQEFCDYVFFMMEPGTFFTITSLRVQGLEHKLDELGFGDYFLSALLAEDKQHFTYRNFGTTKLFFCGRKEASMESFLQWLLEQRTSIEVYDLLELLENQYGIKTDITKLRENAQGAGLYYDSIMKTIYVDYNTYFEEI